MLSRVAASLLAPGSARPSLISAAQRLLSSTPSSASGAVSDSNVQGTPGGGTGSPGSQGAAPGRAAGSDEEVKFGDEDASPSSGELYGREDRDPLPSPNPGLTQQHSPEMSFPRDEPSRGESEAAGAPGSPDGSGSPVAKDEGIKDPQAYPIQNDPSVPEGAGPELSPQKAEELQQDESTGERGPKAAGQGVVEGLAKEDPERYGSGRSSPA